MKACLDQFKLSLTQLEDNVSVFSFQLDDAFYQSLEQNDIKGGSVQASVTINKVVDAFDITLEQQGEILIECQRCLENMVWPVDCVDHLVLKY